MRFFNNIKLSALGLLAAASALVGCRPEEVTTASAVAASVESLTFAAVSAPEQTIEVYADGEWVAEVADEWITITPSYGTPNTEVVVKVADNVSGGVVDTPRKGKIIFKGSSSERQGEVVVYQKGDAYKGVEECSVTQAIALNDEQVAKIPGAQVVAMSETGIVVSDGTSNMYVKGTPDVAVGDTIFMNGEKTTINGVASFILDEFEVLSHSDVAYPKAKDITADLDSYESVVSEYIQVEGSIVFGVIRVASAKQRLNIQDPTAIFYVDELNTHKVVATGYYTGVDKNGNKNFVVTSVEDKGVDESLIPYPVMWSIGAGAKAAGVLNYTTESFAATSSFEAIQGLGTITYVPALGEDGKPCNNDNNKYLLDVQADNPRVTGPWPGDYWLFTGAGRVAAGSKVRIVFEARTSATGHKFWLLEYHDGEKWKVAGEAKTTSEPGDPITYTHIMNADGATNVHVDELVSFNHNMERCEFRFRCMANWQASGAGKLAARNGGTARLAVTDVTEAGVENWPHLYMVEEGDGVDRPDTDPVMAQITTNVEVLAFEGTPAGAQKLNIKSDHDFTVSTDTEWLSLDVTEGEAGESVDVMVTCEPTTLSVLRQGQIKISSADSKKIINVVQSAAGQDLDAFVALGSNSEDVTYKSQTLKVKVQSTEAYTIKSDVDWITLEPVTRTIVSKTQEVLYIAENESTTEARTGHVVFAIADKGVETVLTVNQAAKPATPSAVIYEDDFEWMRSYIDYYNANAGKTVGSTIEDKNASANSPQIYDTNFMTAGLPQAFADRGWSDLNPNGKMVYINDAYLKLSKTGGNNTAVKLSLEKYMSGTSDLTVAFDYAMQIQGSGTVDEGPIVLQIVGDGTFENGTKYSDPIVTAQKTGELFWNHATGIRINGASANTGIVFINGRVLKEDGSYNWSVAGAGRFFLDNIKIEKAKAAPQVIWNDDFSWLREMIAEYNAANATPIGNSVTGYAETDFKGASGANAPNAYTAEPFKSKFPAALEAAGYEDLNADGKVIYPQDEYLKFGKTSVHTSLKIKALPLTETANLTVEFDWCRHVQGTAIIDPVTLTVVITGDGMFENGTKYSDPLETPQTYVEGVSAQMGFTHSSVKIEGAGANTQINIVYTDCLDKSTGAYNWKVSGAHRYHIDNLKITKE